MRITLQRAFGIQDDYLALAVSKIVTDGTVSFDNDDEDSFAQLGGHNDFWMQFYPTHIALESRYWGLEPLEAVRTILIERGLVDA